jgi:hypothetical protein
MNLGAPHAAGAWSESPIFAAPLRAISISGEDTKNPFVPERIK